MASAYYCSGHDDAVIVSVDGVGDLLSAVVGLLQAWDSGAFGAGPLVLVLTLAGVGLVSAAIAGTTNQNVRLTALASAFVLLTIARMMAPFALNTLHLALFVPAIYMLVAYRWFEQNTTPQHS